MAYGGTVQAHAGRGMLMRRDICLCQRDNGEHGRDEQQLAEFDADVKEQQRDGDRLLRQTDLG